MLLQVQISSSHRRSPEKCWSRSSRNQALSQRAHKRPQPRGAVHSRTYGSLIVYDAMVDVPTAVVGELCV